MKVSDNTAISMPMRNLLSILAAVGIGVYSYFGIKGAKGAMGLIKKK